MRDPVVFRSRIAPLRRRACCNSRPWRSNPGASRFWANRNQNRPNRSPRALESRLVAPRAPSISRPEPRFGHGARGFNSTKDAIRARARDDDDDDARATETT